MITCKLQGGIGNLMFQIATTHALATRNKTRACFNLRGTPASYTKHIRDIEPYTKSLFRNLVHGVLDKPAIYKERKPTYKAIPFQENLMLVGYFQSARYFDDVRNLIRNIFSPPLFIKKYHDKYRKAFEGTSVSIHIRRGDYLKLQNKYIVQPLEYYQKALEQIPHDNVLVFSDDLAWCRKNFKGDKYVFIDEGDWQSLCLMSMCSHNVICNSSFSWWAAYLNRNPDRIVIAPKQWYHPSVKRDTSDLYCKNWRKV